MLTSHVNFAYKKVAQAINLSNKTATYVFSRHKHDAEKSTEKQVVDLKCTEFLWNLFVASVTHSKSTKHSFYEAINT